MSLRLEKEHPYFCIYPFECEIENKTAIRGEEDEGLLFRSIVPQPREGGRKMSQKGSAIRV